MHVIIYPSCSCDRRLRRLQATPRNTRIHIHILVILYTWYVASHARRAGDVTHTRCMLDRGCALPHVRVSHASCLHTCTAKLSLPANILAGGSAGICYWSVCMACDVSRMDGMGWMGCVMNAYVV